MFPALVLNTEPGRKFSSSDSIPPNGPNNAAFLLMLSPSKRSDNVLHSLTDNKVRREGCASILSFNVTAAYA